MSRKLQFLLAAIALIAWFGFRAWQRDRSDASAHTAASAGVPAPLRKYGRLAFEPCSLPTPRGGGIEAQCTTLPVPENPAKPDGRKIALNIAWLPATEEADATDDPVFFLAGGPGQAAVESFPLVEGAFAEVRKHRHVVLVDQRGTGKSNPLPCPMDIEDTGEDMAANLRMAETCRDALAKKADLRYYATTDAVRDLDAVRKAIGAPRINLVGVSYGTRVAQQYAMRHPQSTRSIVLDSVVPNTIVLGNIIARNLDDALALQFGRCSADPACRGKVGDPRKELDTLLATLRAEQPLVRFRDASTGLYREERLHPMHVAGLVRMYAYQPAAAALLPMLVHDANQGRYEGLMALSQMLFGEMQDMLAMGMHNSVACSEDGDRVAANSADAGTVLGNTMAEFIAAQCRIWPKGEVPADFHRPLASGVPALVLEGEFDPITPPKYGRDVVAHLPNGRLFVLRGQGHSVLSTGCAPKLFAQFLDKADAKALDGKCLDALAYATPFTSYNGSGP